MITLRSLFLLALALPALAQTQYVATTGNVSLSSQTTAATLQQPSTGALNISFPKTGAGAKIYCSAACVASVIRTAVAPTATAGTVNKFILTDPTPAVTFFTASNYSGGTTLFVLNVAAGATLDVDLSSVSLPSSGSTSNITIAIASVTATANITFLPIEQH